MQGAGSRSCSSASTSARSPSAFLGQSVKSQSCVHRRPLARQISVQAVSAAACATAWQISRRCCLLRALNVFVKHECHNDSPHKCWQSLCKRNNHMPTATLPCASCPAECLQLPLLHRRAILDVAVLLSKGMRGFRPTTYFAALCLIKLCCWLRRGSCRPCERRCGRRPARPPSWPPASFPSASCT